MTMALLGLFEAFPDWVVLIKSLVEGCMVGLPRNACDRILHGLNSIHEKVMNFIKTIYYRN